MSDTSADLVETHSGFVCFVGRPNAGKSSLLNAIVNEKISIVSDKVQTTRTQVRGILTHDKTQIVFVDTPGVHKPQTLMGQRLNDTAFGAIGDVDLNVFVIDGTKAYGRGDEFVVDRLSTAHSWCVVNKVDRLSPDKLALMLTSVAQLGFDKYFPISSRTGEGIPAFRDALVAHMPVGPWFYPATTTRESPDETWVADLVREQLLAVTRDELPHSVATQVTEWDWPRIRCEIIVERDSQKPIVIGSGGAVLKQVGTRVRAQLPPGAFIELFVRVDPDWQNRPRSLDRLNL